MLRNMILAVSRFARVRFKTGATGACVIKWVVRVQVLCLLDLNRNST